MTIIGMLNKINGQHGQIEFLIISISMSQFIIKFLSQQFTPLVLDIYWTSI
jgi:hypothetical protein